MDGLSSACLQAACRAGLQVLCLGDTSPSHWELKKVKLRQYSSFMGQFYLLLSIFRCKTLLADETMICRVLCLFL